MGGVPVVTPVAVGEAASAVGVTGVTPPTVAVAVASGVAVGGDVLVAVGEAAGIVGVSSPIPPGVSVAVA